VEKRLGAKKSEISQAEFRRLCKEYAETYINRQRDQFIRLGVLGTWSKPYLTMDREYEATNVRVFRELYRNGLIYKGKKPIYWCYHDRTALAEAEIEYYEKTSPSIKVLFELKDRLNLNSDKPVYAVIWTTTPWTLPANQALAFHPEAEYGAYDCGDKVLIVAEKLKRESIKDDCEKIAGFSGKDFEGLKFRHTLYDTRESLGITADFVDLKTGTGIVHIAPGHGEEDFMVGQKYGLEVMVPVDDDGRFTQDAGIFAGLRVDEANESIIGYLNEKGRLLGASAIAHSYPHCWRCKNPVIFRATEQWFIAVKEDGLKKDALKAISEVSWIPEWSINRIKSMVEQRPDWCISRQRSWGVPIPVIYCETCGEVQGDDKVFEGIEEIFRNEGADSWFIHEAEYFLPANHTCSKCGSSKFAKETDIFDVWFESGISHFAVLKNRDEVNWPADLYLEGSDQHRGWFQSSLLTSAGVTGNAPYRAVLTHGFIVDEEGRKMSKSLGNVVDPLKVIDRLGADVLRLWVVSSDYSSDIAVSDQILERVADVYRRIRNTIRFMLGNLYDFDPEKNLIDFSQLTEIDRYMLGKFKKLYLSSLDLYENYRYHNLVHGIHSFIVTDLSAFYLDVLKDRLYADAPDSSERRSTQTAIYVMLKYLLLLIAPVLPFTAEQAYEYLPGKKYDSVHLEVFDRMESVKVDEELIEKWEKLVDIRKDYLKVYEEAKNSGVVKTMMEAEVFFAPKEELKKLIEENEGNLYFVFTAREVRIGEDHLKDAGIVREQESGVFGINKTGGSKCLRCWNWSYDVSDDLCERCREVLSRTDLV
jgi:isoleucyl-tRNA synthetase